MDVPKTAGTEEEREALHRNLLRQSQSGDRLARDAMVQNNMGLVWSIVRRFNNRGYELEDLFQIGSIGLMKAIDKFDVSFSVKFSTYAVPIIYYRGKYVKWYKFI